MTASPFIGAIAFFVDPDTGLPLSLGNVYFWQAGTSNVPQATWSDSGETVANPNPIPLNSAGLPIYEIWGEGIYHIMWYDQNGVLKGEIDNFFLGKQPIIPFVVTTGTPNAYIATPSPAEEEYYNGLIYNVYWNFTNTGSATINFNNLGAISLVGDGAVAIPAGGIEGGTISQIIYNGGLFYVSRQTQRTELPVYTSTGSANAYAINPSPALISYSGQVIYAVQANFTNTNGGATLNISGLGANPIKTQAGQNPVAGDIVINNTYFFAVYPTYATLLNPSISGGVNNNYYTASGSGDPTVYTVTAPSVKSYYNGLTLNINPDVACTAAPSINVNSLGNISIINYNGVATNASQMQPSNVYSLIYVNGLFQLNNFIPRSINYAISTGTPNEYTIAPTPSVTYLTDDMEFNILFNADSVLGAATLDVGTGEKPLVDFLGHTNFQAHQILANTVYTVRYQENIAAFKLYGTIYPAVQASNVGGLVVQSSTSELGFLGQGVSGQILTSSGTNANPTWQNKQFIQLASGGATASVVDLTLDSVYSNYSNFRVEINYGWRTTTSSRLALQFYVAGSLITAANYIDLYGGGATTSSTYITLDNATAAGTTNIFGQASFTIPNVTSILELCGDVSSYSSGGAGVRALVIGGKNVTNIGQITGIRIFNTNGINFSYIVKIYGMV